MSAFYIVKPHGHNWEPAIGRVPVIFEAKDDPSTVNNPLCRSVIVLAPEFFAREWKSLAFRMLLPCTGPARRLNHLEYVQLAQPHLPKKALPPGFEKS